MLSIAVNNIQIRAGHGMYPEEAIRGNDFEVDVAVFLPIGIQDDWPLIDYSRISEIVHFVMLAETVPIMEMLVQDIWIRIKQEWPELAKIRVAIRKLNPPMKGDVHHAQVSFEG